MWLGVSVPLDEDRQPQLNIPMLRRQLASLWNVQEGEVFLNVSVAIQTGQSRASSGAVTAAANIFNLSLVSIGNLYQGCEVLGVEQQDLWHNLGSALGGGNVGITDPSVGIIDSNLTTANALSCGCTGNSSDCSCETAIGVIAGFGALALNSPDGSSEGLMELLMATVLAALSTALCCCCLFAAFLSRQRRKKERTLQHTIPTSHGWSGVHARVLPPLPKQVSHESPLPKQSDHEETLEEAPYDKLCVAIDREQQLMLQIETMQREMEAMKMKGEAKQPVIATLEEAKAMPTVESASQTETDVAREELETAGEETNRTAADAEAEARVARADAEEMKAKVIKLESTLSAERALASQRETTMKQTSRMERIALEGKLTRVRAQLDEKRADAEQARSAIQELEAQVRASEAAGPEDKGKETVQVVRHLDKQVVTVHKTTTVKEIEVLKYTDREVVRETPLLATQSSETQITEVPAPPANALSAGTGASLVAQPDVTTSAMSTQTDPAELAAAVAAATQSDDITLLAAETQSDVALMVDAETQHGLVSATVETQSEVATATVETQHEVATTTVETQSEVATSTVETQNEVVTASIETQFEVLTAVVGMQTEARGWIDTGSRFFARHDNSACLKRGTTLGRVSHASNDGTDTLPEQLALERLRETAARNMSRVITVLHEWDQNGDGIVSRREFHLAMAMLDVNAPKETIDSLFNLMDKDESGGIEYKELQAALQAPALHRGASDAKRKVPGEPKAQPILPAATKSKASEICTMAAATQTDQTLPTTPQHLDTSAVHEDELASARKEWSLIHALMSKEVKMLEGTVVTLNKHSAKEMKNLSRKWEMAVDRSEVAALVRLRAVTAELPALENSLATFSRRPSLSFQPPPIPNKMSPRTEATLPVDDLLPAEEPAQHMAVSSVVSESTRAGPRPPIALVAVLDNSGSMEGEKLENLKQSVGALLDQVQSGLKEGDRIGLISFDEEVRVSCALRRMNKSGFQLARRAVDGMKADGKSNLSGAMVAAMDMLSMTAYEPATRAVLVFTDHKANRGTTRGLHLTFQDIVRHARLPVQVFTFGYGSDQHDTQLRALADSFGGAYYSMETELSLELDGVEDEPPDIAAAVSDCFHRLIHGTALSTDCLPTIQLPPPPRALQRSGAWRGDLAVDTTRGVNSSYPSSRAAASQDLRRNMPSRGSDRSDALLPLAPRPVMSRGSQRDLLTPDSSRLPSAHGSSGLPSEKYTEAWVTGHRPLGTLVLPSAAPVVPAMAAL